METRGNGGKKIVWALPALCLLTLAYCAWPIIGAAELAAAARAGDTAAIMRRIDVPALRRSLAGQIVAAYIRQDPRAQKLGPWMRSLAGSVGTTVADALLEEMLTQENLATLLAKGHFEKGSSTGLLEMPRFSEIFADRPLRLLSNSYFDGLKRFVVVVGDGGYGVHLHLSGTTWQFSGLDIPPEVSDGLAREIRRRQKPS
jgi:hypothetical protein